MGKASRMAKGGRTGCISAGIRCVMQRADPSGCHRLESGRRPKVYVPFGEGQMAKGWCLIPSERISNRSAYDTVPRQLPTLLRQQAVWMSKISFFFHPVLAHELAVRTIGSLKESMWECEATAFALSHTC